MQTTYRMEKKMWKGQLTEWKKIFISDKGLIFKIYREFKLLNSKIPE